MLFRTLEGEQKFICHRPNQSPWERPHMISVRDAGDTIFEASENG